jgi:hypothetical protein
VEAKRRFANYMRRRLPLPGSKSRQPNQAPKDFWHIWRGSAAFSRSFYRLMAELSRVPHPLLQILQGSLREVTITEVGRNAIEGRADHMD